MNKRFQRGDTIVEVMIAMAVLGLVLASAFAIANRSYATGINAQERTEALKIAESQVELLRIASNSTDDTLLDVDPLNPNRLFCIDPNGANLERVNLDIGKTVPDLGDLDPIGYPPGCLFGTGGRYYVSIQQAADLDSSGVPTGGKIFSIRVYWESIFGGLSNVVNHEYRTYNFEGAFSLVSPVITCNDLVGGAINIGDPLPCIYPPITCQDIAGGATNIGFALPCVYPPASVAFVVRKIPPAAGNTTPSCASPATVNRSGTTLQLNSVNRTTNSASTATFNNLSTNTPYVASAINAPSGHQLCSTTTAVVTGGPGSTVTNTVFKIRPVCQLTQTGTTAGYWSRGARRAALDNWYTTNDGNWPTWNTYIIAGHYSASGTFWYQYSGFVSGTGAYYYLYEANWVAGSPIYTSVCPS